MSYIITTIALAFYDTKTAAIFIGGVAIAKTLEWVQDEWMRRI